jgi:aminopeptidase YwaD
MTNAIRSSIPARTAILTAACAALLAAATALAAQPDPGRRAAAPDQSPGGTIVDAPSNLRQFRPRESASSVRADQVVLRQVFEELGRDAIEWHQHVQTLSNPFFEGRGPGTRGMEIAAEYVEFHLRLAGLEPPFAAEGGGNDAAGYRQPFEFSRPGARVDVADAVAKINNDALREGADFVILGCSGSGTVTAPVTFVGYGIEDGPDEYSSFDEQTDLRGRIALLVRYEPINEQGKSRWDERRFSPAAAMATKLRNLLGRGAAGVLLVNPPGAVDAPEGLETLERSSRFGVSLPMPAAQWSHGAVERLLKLADPQGRNLMAWRKLADDAAVKCVNLSDSVQVTIGATITQPRIRTENVGGVLRGRGALADQWLIVGAHYDHVGYGYTGIRSGENEGRLHPGADDNASGAATLLVLAQRLAQAYADKAAPADLRSVLFLAFSAEEAGLHGSRHFVQNPTMKLDAVQVMLNMDMVGRLRNNELSVGGTGSGKGLMDLMTPLFEHSGLTIATTAGGGGPSDHASFYNAGVPVLFLFTGMHPEYHMPQDEAYTVNPGGAVKIIGLARAMLLELAGTPRKVEFTRVTGDRGTDRGYGPVRLGITPGMAEEDEAGVKIEAVAERGSAERAGIKPDDVIIAWNNAELLTLRDLFEKLQQHRPGDVVNVTVRRGGETIMIPVTLQASRRTVE